MRKAEGPVGVVQRLSGRTGVLQKMMREMRRNWGMAWLEFVWLGLLPLKLWAVRLTVREQLGLGAVG